jgi:uncharacterized protein involved in exopolysaccharide biosynthesis
MDKLEHRNGEEYLGRDDAPLAADVPPRNRSLRSGFMIVGFCALLGGTLPLLLQPPAVPRYVAETRARVQIEDDAAASTAVAAVMSRQSLDNLVHALDLARDPGFAPRSAGVMQVITDILSGGGTTIAQAEAQLRNTLNQAISLGYDRAGRMLRISVTTGETTRTARIAEALNGMVAGAMRDAASHTDPILEGLRQAMARAEAALSGFMEQKDEQRLADLRQFRTDRQALAAQIAQAQTDLAGLARKASQAASMTPDDVLGRPLPDSLEFTGLEYQRQRQVQAKLALDQLSANLGPRHPRILAAQAALDEVRRDMQTAIRQLSTSLQREQAEATRQLADLKSRRDGMLADKSKVDDADRLAKLETAVDEARQNYLQGQQNAATAPLRSVTTPVELLKPPVVRRVEAAVTLPWAWSVAGAGLGLVAASAVLLMRRRRQDLDAVPDALDLDDDLAWMEDVDLLADAPEAGERRPDDTLEHEFLYPSAPPAPEFAVATPLPATRPLVAANDRSLVDQINDVLMANRRAADAVPLPPLVAAVLAGRSGALEQAGPAVHPAAPAPVDHDPREDQEEQEVIALRREMAELRDKLRFYSDRRYAGRG